MNDRICWYWTEGVLERSAVGELQIVSCGRLRCSRRLLLETSNFECFDLDGVITEQQQQGVWLNSDQSFDYS